MEIKDGLLYVDGRPVFFASTPNKRGTMLPSYLVIHYTGDDSPASTINWFKDPSAKVSAHLLIDRNGSITQFGKFTEVLWHAGTSTWKGINGMNSHSIGIELTNLGRIAHALPDSGSLYATHKNEQTPSWWQTYTDAQIKTLQAVSQILVQTYSLKEIVGHDDIAPGRKQDPGPAFNWDWLKNPVSKELTTTSGLNLRSGAGVGYPVITVIPKGDTVEELSRVGSWSLVNYDDHKGYVSNQYLQ